MPKRGETIQTGVDGLVNLVDAKGKLTFKDAAKLMGVSLSTIEEWAHFLAEEKVVDVQYNFRNPVLLKVTLTDDQKQKLEKQFKKESTAFHSRLDSMTTYMDQLDQQITKITSLVSNLDDNLDSQVDDIKDDLREIYRLEEQKNDYHKNVLISKQRINKKLKEIDKHLADERIKYKRYEKEEQNALEAEEKLFEQARSYLDKIKNEQKELENKLTEVKKLSGTIETSIKKYIVGIKNGEERLNKIKQKHESLVHDLQKEYDTINSLIQKNEDLETSYQKQVDQINSSLKHKEKSIDKKANQAKRIPEVVQNLIDNKKKIHEMIQTIKHDEVDIEKKLQELHIKAKGIQYKVGSNEYKKYMADLHKTLDNLVTKRNSFEQRISSLLELLHINKK